MSNKIIYISASEIPSTQANANHVVNMCHAFAKLGFSVKIFCFSNSKNIYLDVKKFYNVFSKNIKFYKCKNIFSIFKELTIFFNFFRYYLINKKKDIYLSRNLFAPLLIFFFSKNYLIYEAHTFERGYRKILQKIIIKILRINTIVISNELKLIFINEFSINGRNIFVLHDAANANRNPNLFSIKCYKKKIFKILKNKQNCKIGYFGNLYKGRGVDFLKKLANKMGSYNFLVFGKSFSYKSKNNLYFYGFIKPKNVYKTMCCVDFLIMPYQKKVFIGVGKSDTSAWMSPLKMFEYMSAKKPIITSSNKVLKEVLRHKENCIMIKGYDVKKWIVEINRLNKNKKLQHKISKKAYEEYQNKYTWNIRAINILKIFKNI